MTPVVLLVYTVKFGKSLGSNRGSAVLLVYRVKSGKIFAVITDRKHLHKM